MRYEPMCFSAHLYHARNRLERFFSSIKYCRRVATRYDKLANNYLAFVQLPSIRLWLRANESTPSLKKAVGRPGRVHIGPSLRSCLYRSGSTDYL